eukprot:5795357-Prymnesium_polylepis.1
MCPTHVQAKVSEAQGKAVVICLGGSIAPPLTNMNALVRLLHAKGARFYPYVLYLKVQGISADLGVQVAVKHSSDPHAARPSTALANNTIRLILRGGGCSASKAAAMPLATVPGSASIVAPQKQDGDVLPVLSTPPQQQPDAAVGDSKTTQLASIPGSASTVAPQISKPAHPDWESCLGPSLEPPLHSGAIALMDAAYVVKMAKEGRSIMPRQLLPPEAFISLQELKAENTVDAGLRVLCISYPWLQVCSLFAVCDPPQCHNTAQPDNPDPRRFNLNKLAFVLKAFLSRGGRWAVFWDFASLFQHLPDRKRTEEEDKLFTEALESLGTFYAHKFTRVLMLTALPLDYPEGYTLPSGANVAKYSNRGWCFCESRWAQLTKDFDYALDLGYLDGTQTDFKAIIRVCTRGGARRPPMTPADFLDELKAKSFTNGKEDRPMVGELYRKGFEMEMGQAKALNYSSLGWADMEMQLVSKVFSMGSLGSLLVGFTCAAQQTSEATRTA